MKNIKSFSVLSIGTEVVQGQINDTNTIYIVEKLLKLGVNCRGRYLLSDDQNLIQQTVNTIKEEVDLIAICGGLGATPDDCTREAITEVINKPLYIDMAVFEKIKQIYLGWKIPLPTMAHKQALLPEGAHLLENEVGLAAGFVYQMERSIIVALPGVPSEMEVMFEKSLLPWFIEKGNITSYLAYGDLMLYGVTETEVGQILSSWISPDSNPMVGVYVSIGTVQVSITVQEVSQVKAEQILKEAKSKIKKMLSEWVYGEDGCTLQEVVVMMLKDNQQKIILLEEKLTNGRVGSAIGEFDPKGEYFLMGFMGATAVQEALNLSIIKEAQQSDEMIIVHVNELDAENDTVLKGSVFLEQGKRKFKKVIEIPNAMSNLKERFTKAVLSEIIHFLS